MAIVKGTWADFGFRKVGPLPSWGGGLDAPAVFQRFTMHGAYTTQGPDWVRRVGRGVNEGRPEAVRVVEAFQGRGDVTDERLRFVADHFWSEYGRLIEVEAKDEALLRLAQSLASEGKRWLCAGRVAKATAVASERQLRILLRDHILPWFFGAYPDGRVAVLRLDPQFHALGALMRFLYTAAQTPLSALSQSRVAEFPTLRHWHASAPHELLYALLDVFNYLFYPFVGGFQASSLLGLVLVFLFDPAETFSPGVYPADWLALPRSHAAFGKEKADALAVLADMGGDAAARVTHRRHLHTQAFSAAERLDLLRWWVGKFNGLLYDLMDVANFTQDFGPTAPIDPVLALEHYLTVDRLVRRTLSVMSANDVGAMKGGVFEIADLYDTLSELFGQTANSTAFFKLLFNPKDSPAKLGPLLASAPAPFGAYFKGLAERLYGELEAAVISSVWLTAKVGAQEVKVRSASNPASENAEQRPAFVASLMRAFRNGHHGYFTSADPAKRPSRYLFLTDGNVPDSISALPALWLLAYLADPAFVGWNRLPVGTCA